MYIDGLCTGECSIAEKNTRIFSYSVNLLDKEILPDRRKEISKISVDGITQRTRPKDIYIIAEKYDICELFITSQENLIRCVQWQIDCIQLEMARESPFFNKGSISSAVHANIYFSINMEGYANIRTRRAWIYNVKELLRLCPKRSIILSFGKIRMSEEEVLEIFKRFKIKKSIASKFYTVNIENMLIQAAVRRFAFKGVISPIQPQESEFKKMLYKVTKPLNSIK